MCRGIDHQPCQLTLSLRDEWGVLTVSGKTVSLILGLVKRSQMPRKNKSRAPGERRPRCSRESN